MSYMFLMLEQGRSLQLRAAYEPGRKRGEMGECLSALAWGISGIDVPEAARRYQDLLRNRGRTPCTEVAKNWNYHDVGGIRSELLLQAISRYGNAPNLIAAYAIAAYREGKDESRLAPLHAEIANSRSRALSLAYRAALVEHLGATGDRPGLVREVAGIVRAFGGDPRPFVQWKLLALQTHVPAPDQPGFRPRMSLLHDRMRALARRHGAAGFEFRPMDWEATEDINRGDLRGAMNTLNDAIELAERVDSPFFRVQAYLRRGRALAAQGRQSAAISDLRRAAAAARLLGERSWLADSYHHMAHAYEARANWPAAIAAADTFVTVAATSPDLGLRMIRLNDAGAIYWKAGFHARANELYREMVRTIDRDSGHYEYAGAYFERIGDLSRAAQYYRRAYAGGDVYSSPKLGLAGATRIYEQLGMVDSAIASARRHDAMVITPEREILLPRLLARHGNLSEAIRLADAWADLQLRRGNPAAYATAINQQAELVLPTDPSRALLLAGKADSIARQVNSISDLIVARRLRGIARARLGNVDGGVRDLLAAVALSATAQNVFLPVTLKTDIADLWARAGQAERALSWYAQADDALDAATKSFDDPVLLAQFRSARRAIFDGAIRTAMAAAPSVRASKLLQWSERKKNTRPGAHVRTTRLPADGRAIIDYLTVGDTVIATVKTSARTTVRILPLSVRATATQAASLVAPLREMRGGRVDVSRARYSIDAAKTLYDGLLRPLEDLIGTETILTIVPDVPLQLVPFDALVATRSAARTTSVDYAGAVYAADRWTITFAPTVQAAGVERSRTSFAGKGLLFVSHAAPGIKSEHAAIVSAWPKSALREATAGPHHASKKTQNP